MNVKNKAMLIAGSAMAGTVIGTVWLYGRIKTLEERIEDLEKEIEKMQDVSKRGNRGKHRYTRYTHLEEEDIDEMKGV
uniref:Uncharacterized protein n=1 Tax=Pithovirus LCDPAC01 TaxID=2506600 RepID=A0A481YMT5_9VIRU|nr:MAG: hypothetical protein LCDPAC01_01060 [Pithovirus LCDPAC01]